MQGLHRCNPGVGGDGGVHLELAPTSTSPLSIDVTETPESRIQRLITENPVVIFGRSACYMCHVMRRLLSTVGVHPTVIELEEDEIPALPTSADGSSVIGGAPAIFIGGTRIGGLESLVALHLGGQLVPKLVEIGALADDVIL